MAQQTRLTGTPSGMTEATLVAVYDTFPDALLVLDDTGIIQVANERAARLFGIDSSGLTGRSLEELMQDDLMRYLPTLTSGQQEVSLDSECVTAGNETVPVHVRACAFNDEGECRILAILRNDYELRGAHSRIAALENQFRHAQKMALLGELTGGISHYFNNIFTGLAGTLAMLRHDVANHTATLVKQAEASAGRAAGFTRRLLTISRETAVLKEPTDVGALVDEMEDFARMTLDAGIELAVNRPKRLETVLSDSAALHHVLLNLITNARDTLHEKERSVSWEPKLAITIDAENVTIGPDDSVHQRTGLLGRFVRIAVSDTGCGMDDATRQRIFEPFYTTKEAGRGTGLGLSTAMQTVEELGGRIDVVSRVGVGSTFTIYLPVTTLKRSIRANPDPRELPRGNETILLVDDDELIRTFGVMALERQGYTVLTASNGRECLDRFMKDRDRIQLVLLDLVLPGVSGGDVLKKLRRIEPRVRVIISSGHVFDRDRAIFAELNADDYILKPYTVSDLAESVRNVLDKT